jgi:superfamily II DNA or RNA helicase
MKLRDYQHEAAMAILREWGMVPSTLVVMPTGCGKTILFADVIRRMFPLKAIVLAHREELIFQARDKIQAVTGFDVEIEMADARACMGGGLFDGPQVIVSTIQTQTAGGDGGGRMGKFDPNDFGVLIVDECHHAVADTYRRAIAYYRTNPDLRVLGVTATPDRADEEALGQVYETVAFDYDLHNAIRDGWLVPIEQQIVEVEGLDFSSVRTTAGDLNGADLAAVMEYEKNLHGIADPTLQIISDRRALVFAASVAHAERLADIFNRHRPGTAGWLCGKTEKEDRRRILADFAAGRLRIVVNVGVLTEGFDDPGVEVIVMGRPTKSRSLYAQMVGRATRPLPGLVDGLPTPDARRDAIARSPKPACLVIDFVGNSGRHKLVSTADILGGNVSEAAAAAALAQARATGKPVRMDDALADAQAEIDARHALEEARRARIIGKATYRTSKLDPFDILGLQPVAARGWDVGKQLSEKQRGLLAKQGIDPDGLPYAQARQIIGELFRRWDGDLCSFKQAKLLRKYGYDANVSRTDAKGLIDRIAAAGWRRPAEEEAFA